MVGNKTFPHLNQQEKKPPLKMKLPHLSHPLKIHRPKATVLTPQPNTLGRLSLYSQAEVKAHLWFDPPLHG